MPILTGTIADVTGTNLPPSLIRQVFVKAPGERPSLADGGVLIVSAPVQLGSSGSLSVTLEPGPAVLTVDTVAGGPNVYDLYVTADMTLLSEAIDEAAPERERLWAESVMVQLRDEAVAAAGRAEQAAEDVDSAIAGAADQVVQAVEADRVAAEAAASAADGSASAAAGSASAASLSASDAASSATAAGSSASAAAGSAGDAAVSATAAAGSATAAADSASTASAGAQVITDNLAAIEAAPGHAQAAQAARAGAESARDAASGSAGAASGSASDAAGSALAAAGSASDADASAQAAAGSESAASGHAITATTKAGEAATSASSAATAAGRAEAAANSFGLSVTTSTGAPGSNAAVTVSGEGPSYTLGFTVPQGAKGEQGKPGEVSQAMLDAAVATLVNNAPEALNTLSELATALGNDPNFATTTAEAIGKRVLIDGAPAAYNTLGKLVTALQNHELGGSTDASLLTGALTGQVDASAAMVTYNFYDPWEQTSTPSTDPVSAVINAAFGYAVQALFGLDSKSDVGHKHPVSDMEATGTASSSTFLRGDGTWATPANTTYSAMSQAEAENAASTTARLATGQRLHQAVTAHPRLAAAPATWRWNGTTLPTSASQVHAQARAGDFIVAPNLTVDPGWHQITGV